MLKQLNIQNFALVRNKAVQLDPGMTVITGETGAGKSMLLDALELTLGSRADPSLVRNEAERTELEAHFDIHLNRMAQRWLEAEELDGEDKTSCTLRRTMRADGRSKAYINGYAVPLNKIKQLSLHLINLYGQHEHQHLLKREAHRDLVDAFADHGPLLDAIHAIYKTWQQKQKSLRALLSGNENQSRKSLLEYQVSELDELALQPDEYAALCQEHKEVTNLEGLIQDANRVLNRLENDSDGNDLLSGVADCQSCLETHATIYPRLREISECLNAAYIQMHEAAGELNAFLSSRERDPERLQYLEDRLAKVHDIARKHHIKPTELVDYHQDILSELKTLEGSEEALATIKAELGELESRYQIEAEKLRKSRQKAATKLSQHVTKQIQQLGMPQGQFEIHFTCVEVEELNPHGTETIEFMISTNPGRPLQPLHKVASGGELSRIALAIQVITAQTGGTPTLVFDEVDVGIGGGTAEIVGKLLRKLGNQAQVICITHQPQVAASGHNHIKVEKHTDGRHTESTISPLKQRSRVQEIARMLGGLEITQKTLQHASEMLQLCSD